MLRNKRSFPLLIIVLAFLFAGCSPTVDIRGNLFNPEDLERIKAGETTMTDLRTLLGPPSTTPYQNPRRWIYIGRVTHTIAFLRPSTDQQQIYIFEFDDDNILSSIEKIPFEKFRDLTPNENETPTYGKDLSILQEMVGNIGKFGRPQGGRMPGRGNV